MTSNMRSNLIDVRSIAATIEHTLRALMKHVKLQKLINAKTSKRDCLHLYSLTTQMHHQLNLIYLRKKGSESYRHILDRVKVVLKF